MASVSEHDTEQEEPRPDRGQRPGSPEPGARLPDDPATERRRRGPRRAVRKGTERESGFGVTRDERGGHGSNDDRLQQDVPPHW